VGHSAAWRCVRPHGLEETQCSPPLPMPDARVVTADLRLRRYYNHIDYWWQQRYTGWNL
jgi:hypothetical protein